MDVDVDDCFYDDFSLLVSSPNSYGFNNTLDDIIDSTVSTLDSSLDLNAFIPEVRRDHIFPDLYQSSLQTSHDLDFNLDSLSSFSSPTSSITRTPSTSSGEGPENFDDLINFLNEDSTKSDKFTSGNLFEFTQERNTPSPTGSYSSSTGSSTSGVHSDVSDAAQNKSRDHIDVELAMQGAQLVQTPLYVQSHKKESTILMRNENNCGIPISTISGTNFQHQPASTCNNTTQLISEAPNLTPLKPLPLLPGSQITTQKSHRSEPFMVDSAASNITKPKTIFLSSHDYKALMLKMNSSSAKVGGGISPQVPKIVMKTLHGKVVGNNKIEQATREINRTHNSPKQAKYHQQTSATKFILTRANNATAASATEHSKSIYRGTIDEKMYKKQQRMIKNRESASLSRKKKKEYVDSLETRINKLERENYTLKGENGTLRNQLVAFAKTCKCRNANASEFVLNSLNVASKLAQQNVKIAPKPKSSSHRMNATAVKKNVAVLFAMAFMVTLNAGNFQSYLNKQNMDEDGAVLDTLVPEASPISRHLLWVDTEEEYNEKLNRSKRPSDELLMPPLHFLHPSRRNLNTNAEVEGIKTNSTSSSKQTKINEPPPLAYPTIPKCNGSCKFSTPEANTSEYSRIADKLQKWANGKDYFNLSMHSNFGNERDNPHGFKLSRDYLELKPDVERQPQTQGKRKIYMDFDEYHPDIKHKQPRKMESLRNSTFSNKSESIALLNGIKRQDDTFYVLSFNMDHILLPASTFNKSVRPKMSLLLPTGDPTRNGDIVLMQVDCEVYNTKELELKSHMIPSKLRPNVTKWHPPTIQKAQNETESNTQFEKLPVKYEKPRVRTFFMVGPKNQAAAAASLEKPRLVKFNSSMINNTSSKVTATSLNGRNRETQEHVEP